ncbi:tetratricopeptide repeat protein [Brachyspira pilosicoli]|uniref:Tetratricopeptide repeat protein n=1 Tax=Brachyspira pilosicoli TaxID=52584 RepID=A0A5C8F3B4_BRAPL|nr:tetratricopeptide repeat protein [Brachyspira pilosicoli]TXJ43692.1 tetratricopeptide repeat protein [Brachyspira pilosicoli]
MYKTIKEKIKEAKEILSNESENKEALKTLYTSYMQIEDYKKSKIYLKKYLEIEKNDYNAWKILGNYLDMDGNFKEAEKAYLKALEINDKDIRVFANLARTYIKLDDKDNAYKTIQKAIELKSSDEKMTIEISNILCLINKYDEAINLLENFYQICYSKSLTERLAYIYEIVHSYDNAVELYKLLYDEKSLLNIYLYSTNQFKKAAKICRKNIYMDYNNYGYKLADIYLFLGYSKEAIKILKLAKDNDKYFYMLAYMERLSKIYEAAKKYSKAAYMREKMANIDPDEEINWAYLSKYRFLSNDYDRAIEAAKEALEIDKDYRVPLYYLAASYKKQGKDKKAYKIYNKLISNFENRAEILKNFYYKDLYKYCETEEEKEHFYNTDWKYERVSKEELLYTLLSYKDLEEYQKIKEVFNDYIYREKDNNKKDIHFFESKNIKTYMNEFHYNDGYITSIEIGEIFEELEMYEEALFIYFDVLNKYSYDEKIGIYHRLYSCYKKLNKDDLAKEILNIAKDIGINTNNFDE